MASVVDSTRFKSMKVGTTMSIRDFATRNGLEFKPGRGFYQLTKPETIQVYKEIVARRKTDSAIVSGAALRKILGIPETSDTKKKFKLDRSTLEDFDIFIQSTSYTRKLMGGTDFLYEVDGAGVSSPFKARQALQGAKDRQAKEAEYRPPLPTGGPGSPIDIVFSFDTTGSMGGCIMEVRKRVEEVIGRLLKDIPNIRIAVLAHGDYCDKANYVTKWVDFTDDLASLSKFVKTVKTTGGGDYPECYELVLYQVRTELSWRDGSQRSLVMIGDAIPHEASEAQNYLSIDWREECGNLASKLGCRVYSVQCHAYGGSNTFWEEMAKLTYGSYLKLDQFSTVIDFIMAICYRERGPEFLQQYEKEVRAREVKSGSLVGGDMNKELHNLFATLKSADGAGPSGAAGAASTSGAAKGGMKRGASILAEISGPGAAKKAKSSPKKAAPKKPAGAAKKPAGAAKKPAGAAKKPAGAAKKPPAKKTPAKKAPAKKAPAKKAPAKKAPAKKAPAKKAPAKKAPAKKAATKKSPAKKAPAKKAPAKKAPAKKAPAKKAPAKKGKGKK